MRYDFNDFIVITVKVITIKLFFIFFLTYGDGGQINLFEIRKLFAKGH